MITFENDTLIVTPPDEFTIGNDNGFFNLLKESLPKCEKIALNLLGIVDIDSYGFQIIISTKKSYPNKEFKIIGMSNEASDIIELYNAENFLNL